jgi:hypothetical protein
MKIPPTLDLGFCTVNEVTSEVIEIENTGQITAAFEWKFDAPFSLVPAKGILQPGEKQSITVNILPQVVTEIAKFFIAVSLLFVSSIPLPPALCYVYRKHLST